MQLGSFCFQGHKSLGFWNGLDESDYATLSLIYKLPASALRQESEKYSQRNQADAAELLRIQPLLPELWRRPCSISILGDSISSYRMSFWRILKAALDTYPVTFHDFSISGQKSGDLLASMYPNIFCAHAQIAHLMIGTNDCRRTLDAPYALHTGLAEYEKNIRFLISSLRSGGTKVILSSIPPVDIQTLSVSFPEHRIEYRENDRLAFNAALRRITAETETVFNDMEPLYKAYSPQELTIDEIHLNRTAHLLLATRILRLIQQIREQEIF